MRWLAVSLHGLPSLQSQYSRDVIVICGQEDYQEATSRYGSSGIGDTELRPYEPPILVHSTTNEAFKSICVDGFISSWNTLKQNDKISEPSPIGRKLGDPIDFSDYVMLGGGVACEIVVSSKQKGSICMDTDCDYQPGARFYFDVAAIARDGLLVRDGAHFKVRGRLPLEYALFCATLGNVAMQGKPVTPANFARRADDTFRQRYPDWH